VLDLVDAGAESPRETWLRLLLIHANYPRPRTQIPLRSPDGQRQYYLDMGWEDLKLAVEYDGDQHRSDPVTFAYDIMRLADVAERGWHLVRVAARSRRDDVLPRVQRAWEERSTLR
jgi:very-short-patch-repair endonuclease